jgi:1-acyl-sn-glycerol-3-phosphate acyltransferase
MLVALRILLASLRIILIIVPMAILILSYILLTSTVFKHNHDRAFRLRRWYLHYMNFILGINTKVVGELQDAPALYVSNHRSLSDPLILCRRLDAYIIAKAEVARYPLISTGAELTGILYVERNDKSSRSAVREQMKLTLKEGHNVLVYPEGTVNCHKKTLEYRNGTFREAAALGIPVVPVCLEYKRAKDVWCKRSMIKHYFLQFGYLFTEARLHIGSAIYDDDGLELRRKAEAWTNATIDKIHNNWDSYFNENDTTEK